MCTSCWVVMEMLQPFVLLPVNVLLGMYIHVVLIHVLMRDEEKERRKKQARSNKQQGKATQHTHLHLLVSRSVILCL